MARSAMKEQLHQRLWGAQARWFRLREAGTTKHDLKIMGLREQGEVSAKTGKLLFTGNTRLTYERELKRFIGFCHDELGRQTNDEIGARDFAAYMEACLVQGSTAGYLNKLKSAISKFGAVFGKTRSFRAMSKRWGKRIRALHKEGSLASPARPRVTLGVTPPIESRESGKRDFSRFPYPPQRSGDGRRSGNVPPPKAFPPVAGGTRTPASDWKIARAHPGNDRHHVKT